MNAASRNRLPKFPSIGDLATMSREELVSLLADLDVQADALATARGAVRALLLEAPRPASLLDAKETGRRLGVSTDTVRDRGAYWGIEVYLGEGLYRYDPTRVEALRQRRRPGPGSGDASRHQD